MTARFRSARRILEVPGVWTNEPGYGRDAEGREVTPETIEAATRFTLMGAFWYPVAHGGHAAEMGSQDSLTLLGRYAGGNIFSFNSAQDHVKPVLNLIDDCIEEIQTRMVRVLRRVAHNIHLPGLWTKGATARDRAGRMTDDLYLEGHQFDLAGMIKLVAGEDWLADSIIDRLEWSLRTKEDRSPSLLRFNDSQPSPEPIVTLIYRVMDEISNGR